MSDLNDKLLITYGLTNEEVDKLNEVFKNKVSKECIVINDGMAKFKMKEIILGNKGNESVEELPKEKVIIFNGLANSSLQNAINAVRNNLEDKPILAAITPVSINWSFKFLLEHLMEEKKRFSK